jgi:hypothetical protein
MKNPISALVGAVRGGLRKADDAISKKRDQELREMTQAITLEALETLGETLPIVAALVAGKQVNLTVALRLEVDKDQANG